MWIVLMTFISSLDCVFAGISYSARGIRIPAFSKNLLFLTALLVGCLAEFASVALVGFIPRGIAQIMGQLVLIFLGLFMLITTLFDKKASPIKKSIPDSNEPKTLFKLVLKSAGITIQVFKNPEEADIDQSGKIEPIESILLSLALTLDSVGLILCSALIHQNTILFPIVLSIGQLAGIILGEKFGNRLMKRFNHKLVKYLPALVLILIAGIEFIR